MARRVRVKSQRNHNKNKADNEGKTKSGTCVLNTVVCAADGIANLSLRSCEISDQNQSLFSSIKFVADTGATEHFIKSKWILSDFKRSENDYIRSANRSSPADLKLDGFGNLMLISNVDGRILPNVMATSNDRELKIFDKESGETLVRGKYEQHLWVVEFDVQEESEFSESRYETYYCSAHLASIEPDLETEPSPELSPNLSPDFQALAC